MIDSYKATRTILRALRPDKVDEPKVNSMIESMTFSIEWMETGIKPGNRRGIENRSYEQREVLCDPLTLQSYYTQTRTTSHCGASESDVQRIEAALSVLTEKEREVFLMVHAGCLSQERVSHLTGYPRTTIQRILERCKKKLYNTEQLTMSV